MDLEKIMVDFAVQKMHLIVKKNDTVNVRFTQITKGQPLVDLSDFVKRF